MKYIDKFLKLLKTDRNTFFTYLFTLISAYVVIDRIVELLILIFTGMSVSYWGPIKYTLALACPVLGFVLSYPSKFCKSDDHKISFFYVYCVALYVIFISMVVQWLNYLSWSLILALPNYQYIVTEFSDLIIHAFTAISVYIPLVTCIKLLSWLNRTINDPIFPNNFKDSICDYGGIDIAAPDGTTGPYSLEIELCKSQSTGKPVKILETRRFQPTLIVGPSGTGKTSMIMEPMIARDLEKKFFLREISKEMGYTALKTNLATLNCPYDNEYINKNFSLTMLTPVERKEKIYKAYMNKLIYAVEPNGTIVYKNFGVTVVSPDSDHTDKVKKIAENFNIPIIEINPTNPNSIGLNPFIIGDPALCGLIISSVIKTLYHPASHMAELAYAEDISQQAIQNLVMLLKVMYPKMNNGLMPNLEDLLKCFTNFELVEEMCEELKKDEELSKTYALQLDYFKQNFYKDSVGNESMHKYVHFASSLLDILLRAASARAIICNRYNNIDFGKVLSEGNVVLISTRPYEIGGTADQGFGQFFLSLMMCSVEGTLAKLKNRIPHFIYVDEFDRYANDGLGDMFTLYRKFKIGTIYSIQNLTRLPGGIGGSFAQTLLSNAATKVTFGNSTPEEYSWWMNEFGKRREWNVGNNYNKEDGEYSNNLGGVKWEWQDTMKLGKLQGLGFKKIIYKTKNNKGKHVVGFGNVDFLESKYNQKHKTKTYNFGKYSESIQEDDDEENKKKKKFNPRDVRFDSQDGEEVDPIVTNTTDSSYFFDNEDAISFNLGNDNNE